MGVKMGVNSSPKKSVFYKNRIRQSVLYIFLPKSVTSAVQWL